MLISALPALGPEAEFQTTCPRVRVPFNRWGACIPRAIHDHSRLGPAFFLPPWKTLLKNRPPYNENLSQEVVAHTFNPNK